MDIRNETKYDGRSVIALVRWAAKEKEIDGYVRSVRIAHHTGAHAGQGRWYPGRRHAVVRIAKVFPAKQHVYKCKDVPDEPLLETWKEGLVWMLGHELEHARQQRDSRPYRESETEWAAWRLLQAWRKRAAK